VRASAGLIDYYFLQLSGMPHRDEYDPTMGVRILEFDVDIQHDKEGKCNVNMSCTHNHAWLDLEVKVELWDLSGDSRFFAEILQKFLFEFSIVVVTNHAIRLFATNWKES
jgi:hypothetical protein